MKTAAYSNLTTSTYLNLRTVTPRYGWGEDISNQTIKYSIHYNSLTSYKCKGTHYF